jgi:hypothetical protein
MTVRRGHTNFSTNLPKGSILEQRQEPFLGTSAALLIQANWQVANWSARLL